MEGGVVGRVGYLVVVVDGRGPCDGGGDGGRADLLEAHGGGLGLLLVLLLERRRGAVGVLLGRRRGRGAGGELLDDVAELVLADVVYLRLGVRRAGRLLLRRRRRRCLADVPAELVDAEVRVVSAAAAAIAAAAAVHLGGSAVVDLGLAWAEERRWWGGGELGKEDGKRTQWSSGSSG